MAKVIVTWAVTGSVHTPSMSPHLPVTPDQIAKAAIDAAKAGASVVHLHARDPDTGKPTQDPEVYRQFLPQIVAACDVVINITTGGSPILPISERLRPAAEFGRDYIWSVLGAGRHQIPIATMAASIGGNVRVGLEDSLWGPRRELATNAQQVTWIRTILEALGHEAATPDETRALLKLKGAAAVHIPR